MPEPRVRECIDCGKSITRRATRCINCAAKARWNGRRRPVNICLDCGIVIDRKAKRCGSCAATKRCADPTYIAKRSGIHKKLWQDEEFQHKISAGVRAAHQRGDFLEKYSGHSEKIKSAWKRGAYDGRPGPDAETRRLMSIETQRRWDIGLYDTEEYRSKLSRATESGWANGIYDDIFSEETRRKLSENMRRRWENGSLGNEEWCQRRSVSMKERWADPDYHSSHTGENHPNWKGGISGSPYPRDFNDTLRSKIRKRDGFRCALCGRGEEEGLCVHHIDYDKMNSAPFNLISLCISCHAKTNRRRRFWQTIFAPIARGREKDLFDI